MTAQDSRAKLARHNLDIPEVALGTSAVLLGAYVAIDAAGYHDGSTYDGLGPSLLPYIIGGGLILTGLTILIRSLLGGTSPRSLIIPIPFILMLGWIPVITVVFAVAARAFGSRRTLLDLGLGFAFGAVTLLIFNYGLGLNLPVGWIFTRLFG
jgi:putative tricarboxylic transport membrane protein